MRLLITGAGGFLGSHLLEAAQKHWRGDIYALCNYHGDGNIGWLTPSDRYTIVRQDIRDTTAIVNLKPDLVINAAARVSVTNSFGSPDDTWDVNATAVERMVNALPNARIVQISTSEVFDGRSAPYLPSSRPHPRTPYGGSKHAAEGSVVRKDGHTVCRMFNLFGPRQSPRAVIPRMAIQAHNVKAGLQDKVRLYGPNNIHGEPYARAFLPVTWVAEQIMGRIIDDPRPLVQLASDEPVPIADLWRKVATLVGLDPENDIEWSTPPDYATTVVRLYGSSTEGYQTMPFMYDKLAEAVAWFGEHATKWREVIYE